MDDLSARAHASWVVLTGGNPALHDLTDLVQELHKAHYRVAVETQGSRWRNWLRDVDRLCVSPKPPSAQEPKSQQSELQRFLHEALSARADGNKPYEWMFLKIVCFTDADVDYACLIRNQLSDALLYLSAGNDAGQTVGNPQREDTRSTEEVREDLLEQALWLTNKVMQRDELCSEDVFVQAQLHTLLWGNGRGF